MSRAGLGSVLRPSPEAFRLTAEVGRLPSSPSAPSGIRPLGNKLTQTDPRGHTTTYGYDRANRLTAMMEPGNLTTAYDYDKNGNALTITDAKGQTETSTYDELNRKKATVYTAATNAVREAWRDVSRTDYTYDTNGNRERVEESVVSGTDPPQSAGSRSIIQAFDALDRVRTETTTLPDGGISKTLTYEYFSNGTRQAVTLDGKRTAYEYDAQNRVTSMTTSDNAATQYTYYADDLLKDTTTPNGVKATRQYDKAGRLLNLTNAKGTTTTSSYVYTYDTNGNRLTQTETNPTVAECSPSCGPVEATETTSYTYDAANRLKSVTYPADATYPNGRVVTYRHDAAGNREHETETTATGAPILERVGTFDENNRLTILNTTAAPATVPPNANNGAPVPASVIANEPTGSRSNLLTIEYDRNGNEVQRTVTVPEALEGTSVTTSIYDLRDRLVEQTREGQILTRHEYDAEGRRTKKIGEEGIRQYVYDDTSLLAEYSTDGTEIAKYDYGADRLIRLTRADEGTRYMTFDGLGSVTGLTNPSGDVTASYHLDAWGNYRFTSELTTSHNRFGFTGHYWDKEASLYYAKARYYDPFTARFTQADSFLGTIDDPPSLHRYQYANDNPTMYVDPTGHGVLDLLPPVADVIPGIGALRALNRLAAMSERAAGQNISGNFANTSVGMFTNAQSAFAFSAVARTLRMPGDVVDSVSDALIPGGSAYWSGESADTSWAPARKGQVHALEMAATSPSMVDRGIFGALSVLSVPAVVVESFTTAPGGRAAEAMGKSLHGVEADMARGDIPGAGLNLLQAGGEGIASFSAFATLATPFLREPPGRSVWQEDARKRGRLIESRAAANEYSSWHHIGADNGGYFEAIDFTKTINVASMKSADTLGKSWLSTMKRHIRRLASGITVGDEAANVILDLRVPPGRAPAAEPLIDFSKKFGVTMSINEIDFVTSISRRGIAAAAQGTERSVAGR